MNIDGSNLRRLTDDPTEDRSPAWSPNGRRIAFVSKRADDQADIWLMNPDGSNLVRLTFDRAVDTEPAWSPDSRQIAFTSTRDGNAEIYIMDADGGNLRNLTQAVWDENYPAWSPDGNWLSFSRFTTVNEIFIMPVAGKCPSGLPITQAVETTKAGDCRINITKNDDPDWSPAWLPKAAYAP